MLQKPRLAAVAVARMLPKRLSSVVMTVTGFFFITLAAAILAAVTVLPMPGGPTRMMRKPLLSASTGANENTASNNLASIFCALSGLAVADASRYFAVC